MNPNQYPAWGKTERIGKLFMTITEKIDGTNGLIEVKHWDEECAAKPSHHQVGDLAIRAGSRTRWLSPESDNFGFCAWVFEHAEELVKLGFGRHYGEWWGRGIQRQYGLDHKRFSLFNTHRPPETLPSCVHQVPVLYKGQLDFSQVNGCMDLLRANGSEAAPGFRNPEGVIVWLGREKYKHTFEKGHKGQKEAA